MSLLLEAIEVLESRGSAGGSDDGYGLDVEENGDYGGGGSSESSSIGAAEESSLGSSSSTVGGGGGDDEGEEEEEAESKMRRDSFCSLDELEDSLPTKRGLSNFFNGKSKSFATLSDVVTAPLTAADLAKPENPFNKRRRILLANKARWPRRASCGSLSTVAGAEAASLVPPHQPVVNSAANLFSLEEDEEEDDENSEQEQETQEQNQQEDEDEDDSFPSPSSSSQLRKLKVKRNNNPSFRSPRSFSLGDLQHHAHQFA